MHNEACSLEADLVPGLGLGVTSMLVVVEIF